MRYYMAKMMKDIRDTSKVKIPNMLHDQVRWDTRRPM